MEIINLDDNYSKLETEDFKDKTAWYNKTKAFWDKSPATVTGLVSASFSVYIYINFLNKKECLGIYLTLLHQTKKV